MDVEIDKLLIKLAVEEGGNNLLINPSFVSEAQIDIEALIEQCVEQVIKQLQRRADD